MNQENVRFVTVGTHDAARRIAVLKEDDGTKEPGLFWLGGFKSSMQGQKATALAKWASENGRSLLRFDYSGHGLSGGDFEKGTISRWLEEAMAVFETLSTGPQVLIGSSMGGWLALLMAEFLKSSERIAGLVLIAPAWDMTDALMPKRMSDEQKVALCRDGYLDVPSAYDDGPYRIMKTLLDDGTNHLIGKRLLHLEAPVHILHGRLDPDVPWQHGQALLNHLPHDDAVFTLVRDGDHRLSRAEDLDLLTRTIATMASRPF